MTFAKKLNSDWSMSFFQVIKIGPFNLSWIFQQEIARAIEMANGFLLPIICYLSLPAYRQFCTEPDPDDLKLSTPKGLILYTFLNQEILNCSKNRLLPNFK